MASPPFTFTLDITSGTVPSAMLAELTGSVLKHCGCDPSAATAMTAALDAAVAAGTVARRLDVRYQVQAGVLDIQVSSGGRVLWQASCATS